MVWFLAKYSSKFAVNMYSHTCTPHSPLSSQPVVDSREAQGDNNAHQYSRCRCLTQPSNRAISLIGRYLRNSTNFFDVPAQPDTYWGQFDEISKYNVSLNYFERLWAAWYTYMNNNVLATGIMSFVMHEVVYFGRALPWIIIDCIPYFNKYKIQNVRVGCLGTHSRSIG